MMKRTIIERLFFCVGGMDAFALRINHESGMAIVNGTFSHPEDAYLMIKEIEDHVQRGDLQPNLEVVITEEDGKIVHLYEWIAWQHDFFRMYDARDGSIRKWSGEVIATCSSDPNDIYNVCREHHVGYVYDPSDEDQRHFVFSTWWLKSAFGVSPREIVELHMKKGVDGIDMRTTDRELADRLAHVTNEVIIRERLGSGESASATIEYPDGRTLDLPIKARHTGWTSKQEIALLRALGVTHAQTDCWGKITIDELAEKLA